ncbi:hypothetical protein C5167_008299 [Papaver somniferum]|uniref:Uncharacterized protein n=1 Tax=Papaver somniferum TaxID=3469 RepID=A0A4Y7JY24_PAPSO|nr:hypothetical protein C5167_008299 [Papaver somniferum]
MNPTDQVPSDLRGRIDTRPVLSRRKESISTLQKDSKPRGKNNTAAPSLDAGPKKQISSPLRNFKEP